MNKIKKVCVSMAMAVVLLFGGVFSFFGVNSLKAKAVSSEYSHEAIYYFNDAYPSLTHCKCWEEFTHLPFYEYQQVDEDTFNEMANGITGDFESSYFNDITDGALVIIDIKMFMPNDGALYVLFSGLKAKGCTTAFISVYSSDEFSEGTLEYIDYFYQSDFSNMEYFIDDSIRHFTERIGVKVFVNVGLCLEIYVKSTYGSACLLAHIRYGGAVKAIFCKELLGCGKQFVHFALAEPGFGQVYSLNFNNFIHKSP